MGSISRMNTWDRWVTWADENKAWPDGTLISISGGVPEIVYGEGQISIVDIDNLNDCEETDQDYKDAIYTEVGTKVIKGVCPWCLTSDECSYWEKGEECNSEDKI